MNENQDIFFSIVIPAYNEGGNIIKTCSAIIQEFAKNDISDYEIIVVNDNSKDNTESLLAELSEKYKSLSYVNNYPPNGFGYAVRKGLDVYRGDSVCVVMADLSDSPEDIIRYYNKLKEGNDCVFGSRFMKGSVVIDYPRYKLVINRFANYLIKILFNIDHNDITNAFKGYRREVIDGIRPLLSAHFNLTVEMPLKAIARGYNFERIPISWTNRVSGVSKLKLKEMGSRYLFIVLYVLLEKLLSKGDYHRTKKINRK